MYLLSWTEARRTIEGQSTDVHSCSIHARELIGVWDTEDDDSGEEVRAGSEMRKQSWVRRF